VISLNNKSVLSGAIVFLVLLALVITLLVYSHQRRPIPTEPETTETEMPSTIIHLDPSTELGAIDPDLYGINHRYNKGAYGMWDPAAADAYEKFNQAYDEAGFKSMRYPGGTVGNLFRWKESIGPVNQRKLVYSSIENKPIPIDFGVDEAARYVEAHGSTMIYMYGMGAGNAKDAADLVEYLNSPNDGSNPNGGADWAAVRAANGHPEPYNIQYFEIGNEMHLEDQRYWLDGRSNQSFQHNYIFGGTVAFDRQPVVDSNNYNPLASISAGTPNLIKYAPYPPVNQGTDEVFVGDVQWIRVNDLSQSGKDNVYTIDTETGKLTFGDGVHGNIPERNQKIQISYSTTHDGFNQYYEAMKSVDPSIRIYSCLENNQFIQLMGDNYPYDGIVVHSYANLPDIMKKYVNPITHSPDTAMDELHDRMMYEPTDKKRLKENVLKNMRGKVGPSRADQVDIIVTEYGILNQGEVPNKYYRQSLDVALFTAKMLMNWMDLGVPLANKQNLIGDGGAVIGDAPDFVMTPTALMFKMFTHMFGNTKISSSITNNPIMSVNNKVTTGTLQITASKDADGNVYIIAVNGSRQDDVATAIELAGGGNFNGVNTWTLNGESYASFNTAAHPDYVSIREDTLSFDPSSFHYTFPAHSLTAIKLVRSGQSQAAR
jgi:alpha-L-arabinofuranosidase